MQRSELPVEVYDNGARHAYVRLPDEAAVAALEPDIGALGRLGAVGVSCFAAEGARVKTRMFGPGLGMAEDPATGSAAGPLAVHLARHGVVSFGERVEIRQGDEIGRPSMLYAAGAWLRPSGSTACSSAVRPSWWRAASTSSTDRPVRRRSIGWQG